RGNKCFKGKAYAEQEVKNPQRVLTTTVKTQGLEIKMLAVKTSKPIPKAKINQAMKLIKKFRLKKQVHAGEVVIKNILGLDADLIATRDIFF
ncbi:MAG: DUF1667 domain-containing protein, partial [Candidatus Omnitrophica bacterium]|nr:DUF1667 domain-containing protein [Candidatus Omnitrophota bacterium]